jgi:hypothetical protein
VRLETALLLAAHKQLDTAIEKVVGDLTDEQLGYSAPAIDARSIARVALHAYGGVFAVASFVAGQGRPQIPAAATAPELRAALETMRTATAALIAGLTPEQLAGDVTLPWGMVVTGAEAMAGILAHALVHAGAIAGIRAIGGFPTPPES